MIHELGLDKSTLTIFTSDHGEWLGDHGLLHRGAMLYEGLLRVASILKAPWLKKGVRNNQPVSTLDIAPIIYDYARLDYPYLPHGQSLRPQIERNENRDFSFSEWDLRPSRNGTKLKLKTVKTHNTKLTFDMLSETEEMYNLRDDPDEMDNLFDDKGYAHLKNQLMDMIKSRPEGEIPMLEQVGMS